MQLKLPEIIKEKLNLVAGCTSAILATQEAETGGSQALDQPGQVSKTISKANTKRLGASPIFKCCQTA
jgi:hypothetical protein